MAEECRKLLKLFTEDNTFVTRTMDPRLESEVGEMYENFNMQDFLLSSNEDQLMFLTLLNPCHAYKTAFGKRLWADQLLRFLKVVASTSITGALVTLECRIPDIDGENPEDDIDEDEDKGDKRLNSAEENLEEADTTEGENISLEEIDVAALQSLCRLLDEWEDAKLKYYLKKRNVSCNNLTGVSPIKLEAEEAGEEKRLLAKGRQDGTQEVKTDLPEKPSRFLDDIKKSDKSPASVYSGIDSKTVKPPAECTKPVRNPDLGCLYSAIFWDDPKPYSKPLVLGINSTSKPSPSSNTYSQNSVPGKYDNSIIPLSPPVSPQNSISGKHTNSVSSPKYTYPSHTDISTGSSSALPPSPPIRSPSKPSSKAPVTTLVPPAPGQQNTWVSEHQRKGHYVSGYYKKDGTYVKEHYRQGSTVRGHFRKTQ